MLATKRSAGDAELILKIYLMQVTEHASEGIHAKLKTQGRRHQKSKTGISVAKQKGLMASKYFFKKRKPKLIRLSLRSSHAVNVWKESGGEMTVYWGTKTYAFKTCICVITIKWLNHVNEKTYLHILDQKLFLVNIGRVCLKESWYFGLCCFAIESKKKCKYVKFPGEFHFKVYKIFHARPPSWL